jgi:hypothetical protein
MPFRDEDDADLDEREFPDEPDDDDDGDDETVPCPHCLRPVYEDAVRCPHCGQYQSREDAPRRHPWWLVIGVLICLALMSRWFIPW